MATREELVYVRLSVPVQVPIARVADKTIVTKRFQILFCDPKKSRQGVIIIDGVEVTLENWATA